LRVKVCLTRQLGVNIENWGLRPMGREQRAHIGLGIDPSEGIGHGMWVIRLERDIIAVRSMTFLSGETLVSGIYIRSNRSLDDSNKDDHKISSFAGQLCQPHRHPEGKFACRRKTRLF
jgi:hypothetical protein